MYTQYNTIPVSQESNTDVTCWEMDSARSGDTNGTDSSSLGAKPCAINNFNCHVRYPQGAWCKLWMAYNINVVLFYYTAIYVYAEHPVSVCTYHDIKIFMNQ